MQNQGGPGDAIDMSSQQKTQSKSGTFKWRRMVPSPASAFLLVFFIISLLMNGGLNPATKRGFFCNDSTIQYPFKSDTVSFKVLLVIALLMPTLLIKLAEKRLEKALKSISGTRGARFRKDSDVSLDVTKEEDVQLMTPSSGDTVKRRLVINDDDSSDIEVVESDANCDNSNAVPSSTATNQELDSTGLKLEALNIRGVLRESSASVKTFSDLQLFLFGFTATSFLTGIGKMTCGRFRPHFMERCKPNVDCTLPSNLYRYIQDFKCTNEALGPRGYSYITTSWPSGHASIIFFAMLYLVIYLNTVITTLVRLKSRRTPPKAYDNPLIMYSIYVLLIGLAAFVALTRVADYHHHPLDVLSGCIIGTITALVIANCLLKPRFQYLKSFAKSSLVC